MRSREELIKNGIGRYIGKLYQEGSSWANDATEAFGGMKECVEWMTFVFMQKVKIYNNMDDNALVSYAYKFARSRLVFELTETLQRSYTLGRQYKSGKDVITSAKKMYGINMSDEDQLVLWGSDPEHEQDVKEVMQYIYHLCDEEDAKPRQRNYGMTYSYREMLDLFLGYGWDVKRIAEETGQTIQAWSARKYKLMSIVTDPVRERFPEDVIGMAFTPTKR